VQSVSSFQKKIKNQLPHSSVTTVLIPARAAFLEERLNLTHIVSWKFYSVF